MRFKKKVKLGYPRKVKKKFIKGQGRLFYKLRTSRLVRDIIIRQDMRILPSLLTIDTNPNAEKVFTWSFKH